jgi:hypothetical protein
MCQIIDIFNYYTNSMITQKNRKEQNRTKTEQITYI